MNPATGTFITQDTYAGTIFDPTSLHKYLYANANPVMYSDPSGYTPSGSLTEQNAVMSIMSTLNDMVSSAASFAWSFYWKFRASMPMMIAAATGMATFLSNSPAFMDICARFASGDLSIYELQQNLLETFNNIQQSVWDHIYEATNRSHGSSSSGNSSGGSGASGNFDPNDWKKIAEELKKNGTDVSRWNKGSFNSAQDSLARHYAVHGKEVNANSVEQYLRKAEGFAQNLRGAHKHYVDGAVEGVVRYIKNGKYIDLAPDGTIISFGLS